MYYSNSRTLSRVQTYSVAWLRLGVTRHDNDDDEDDDVTMMVYDVRRARPVLTASRQLST